MLFAFLRTIQERALVAFHRTIQVRALVAFLGTVQERAHAACLRTIQERALDDLSLGRRSSQHIAAMWGLCAHCLLSFASLLLPCTFSAVSDMHHNAREEEEEEEEETNKTNSKVKTEWRRQRGKTCINTCRYHITSEHSDALANVFFSQIMNK